ncbi:MAG: hypothetical protein AAB777_02325 [Patescibacteria group bacterium]
MASKFKGGSQGGQIVSTPLKKAIMWIIIGTLILIALIIMAVYATIYRASGKSPWQSERKSTVHETVSSAREGIVTITTEWYGFVVPTGYRLSGTLITKDTWWEVRVNKDRLYTLPPINQSLGTLNTGTDTAYKEYRIKAGQERTSGELTYAFEKLK